MMTFIQMPKQESFKRLRNEHLHDLDEQNNLTLRILTLANLLELTEAERSCRISLCDQLHRKLKQFYPECELLIFGSTGNGFGFQGCDLDILFLPFPGYCNTDFTDCKDAFKPSPHHVLSGNYPKKNLLQMNEKSHLLFIRKVLYTMRHLFKNIIFIPSKNCPILNIKLLRFDFECDLSASNRMAVCNTELLRLFGDFDLRVRPLVIFLRYWAKSLGFIQKGILSSYAFSLMVIFSLQTTEPPLLPSVKSLMNTAGFSRQVDGWETAFTTDLSCIPSSKNKDTIDLLLKHFFHFYWNFDFIQSVVNPYHGHPLCVAELKMADDERIRKFSVTSFNVQDPFLLCRNVARNASTMKTAFKLGLLIAKEQIIKEKFSFRQFFSSDFYQKRMDLLYTPIIEHLPKILVSTIYLTHEIISKLGLSSHTQLNFWYEKASNTILDILQNRLQVKCNVVDKTHLDCESLKCPPAKKRKISACSDQESTESSLDFNLDLNLFMSIQCTALLGTWSSYKNLLKGNKTHISEISKNDGTYVSDAMKNKFITSKKCVPEFDVTTKPQIRFVCNCYKYPGSQIPDILLTVIPHAGCFKSVGPVFLKSFVKTVEKVLHEI